MLIRTFLRLGFSKLVVPIEGKMQAKKKGDYDIKSLKKEMQIIKQNKLNNPDQIYDQIPHRQVYRKMNTSIEAFFNKRSFNIENFNFLLSIVAEQRKTSEIEKVLQMMKSLHIPPTEQTYNYIIRAWAKVGNVQKTEQMFAEYKKLFRPNKYTYTALMMVYKTCGLCEKAQQLFTQMEQNHIVPDLAMYTTLINSHHKSRNVKRCWELDKIVRQKGLTLDQPYIGMMMTVYASTHDAQKAIKLYDQHIKNSPDLPFIQTTNAYLKALASRADYCQRAINYFFLMISKGEYINIVTVASVLKACANLGHVKDATNIVKIMKQKNLEPDEYIYNSLLRCYAGGVSLPNISQQTVELFIADAWRLLDQISKKKMVNVTILNSLLLIFIQALKTEQIDGLVLPLYKKYGIQMNQYTYEQLMKFLAKKDDVVAIQKMWNAQIQYIQKKKKQFMKSNHNSQHKLNNALKRGQFMPTFNSTCLHLESGIKLMDMDKIIESLKFIKQMGRYPKFHHLKYLGELKNLPVQIKAELAKYQVKFGQVESQRSKSTPAWKSKKKEYKDPQDR